MFIAQVALYGPHCFNNVFDCVFFRLNYIRLQVAIKKMNLFNLPYRNG